MRRYEACGGSPLWYALYSPNVIQNSHNVLGHSLCKGCARKHFFTYRQKECPMCRSEARRDDLVDLYLDYGTHAAESLTNSSKSRNNEGECDAEASDDETDDVRDDPPEDKMMTKGHRLIDSLKELAQSEPRTWRGATKPTDEDLGLRLVQTGAFIREIAENSGATVSNNPPYMTSSLTLFALEENTLQARLCYLGPPNRSSRENPFQTFVAASPLKSFVADHP